MTPLPCTGRTGLFYSLEPDDVAEALAGCHRCPQRLPCLARALNQHEPSGMWGGIQFEHTAVLITDALTARDENRATDYAALIDKAHTATADLAGGDERPPWQEARRCARCGAPVPAGRHPIDRAGPTARCGIAATYNKGCRCGQCQFHKAMYYLERR